MPTERSHGLSLLELLAVLTIIGVLATIAVPGYRGVLLRAGRTEARAALLSLATAQEKLYLQCHAYAATLGPPGATGCSPLQLEFPQTTERGAYAISVTDADAASWSATATSLPGTVQGADRTCHVFKLTSQGVKTAVDDGNRATDRECWYR
jgi:type IV pilus assembly protein PilE